VAPRSIVLAGTRDFDPAESEFVEQNSIAVISTEQLDSGTDLLAAIATTGASSVYLHIDVDVLDPGEISGLGYPVPFGLSVHVLTARIREIGAAYRIAGASITEFAPSSPETAADDLPAILRIIAAITATADGPGATS
jgi:arginase